MLAIISFPGVLPGYRETWARSNPFTKSVETSRPLTLEKYSAGERSQLSSLAAATRLRPCSCARISATSAASNMFATRCVGVGLRPDFLMHTAADELYAHGYRAARLIEERGQVHSTYRDKRRGAPTWHYTYALAQIAAALGEPGASRGVPARDHLPELGTLRYGVPREPQSRAAVGLSAVSGAASPEGIGVSPS